MTNNISVMSPMTGAMGLIGGSRKQAFTQERDRDVYVVDGIEVTAGLFFAVLFFMTLLSAVAVYMALKCKGDPVVNVIVALFYPIPYIIGRLFVPCK